MRIYSNTRSTEVMRHPIFASDDTEINYTTDENVSDKLDNIADNIEDMQDVVDDAVKQDDVSIEMDNNISNHYIAECERCQGVFISAMIESDQDVDKISGICPLCEKESDQYLKWVIKEINK